MNCIQCVERKRTGQDLLCDECRAENSVPNEEFDCWWSIARPIDSWAAERNGEPLSIPDMLRVKRLCQSAYLSGEASERARGGPWPKIYAQEESDALRQAVVTCRNALKAALTFTPALEAMRLIDDALRQTTGSDIFPVQDADATRVVARTGGANPSTGAKKL